MKKLSKKTVKRIALAASLLLAVVLIFVFRSSIIPGWYEENGERYYLESPFKRASGIATVGRKTYIFSDYGSHALTKGWQRIDGLRYYAFDNGEMATGEQEIDGETYLFDDNGMLIAKHTVEFVDYDGTVLSTQTVNDGSAATAPENPTREVYTFIGWDNDFSKITSDLTVTAIYEINSYTVKFVDFDGTEIDTQTVSYGSAATAPEAPAREGYKFAGWDKDFSKITSDLTVTAQYSEEDENLLGDFNGWSTDKGKMTLSSDNIFTMT